MKSEKGLTLVMLVITIVVLLILTAVLIFMVMDGGFADLRMKIKLKNQFHKLMSKNNIL